MQLTVLFVLAIGALIMTLVSAAGKLPLWVPVLLLSIILALQVVPIK